MRFELTLIGDSNYFTCDFEEVLSRSICESLLRFSDELFDGFRFYNFSGFHFENYYVMDDNSYYLRDGRISFFISSVDDVFLRCFISKLLVDGLFCGDNHLDVIGVSLVDVPDFSIQRRFVSICPVKVDVGVVDSFIDYIGSLLLDNFHECFPDVGRLNFFIGDLFKKDVGDGDFYNLELVFEGDVRLLEFVWFVGLGVDNFKGFGMMDVK